MDPKIVIFNFYRVWWFAPADAWPVVLGGGAQHLEDQVELVLHLEQHGLVRSGSTPAGGGLTVEPGKSGRPLAIS